MKIQKTAHPTDPEGLRLQRLVIAFRQTGFLDARALADFEKRGVISGEIGLASEAYIFLAGAMNPCLSASSKRVALAPPARDLVEVLLSHNDSVNPVNASRPRVTEHLAQFEREQLAVRQGRQLAGMYRPGDSTNMRVAWRLG